MQSANELSFRIQYIASLLSKESDQVLQEQIGIGMSQFRILRVVQDNTSLLQQQIALTLSQTEASISRQVKLLLRKQMLEMRINPKDRREHMMALTPKGEHVIEAALHVLETFQQQYVEQLSEKQRNELLELLDKIEARIPSVG